MSYDISNGRKDFNYTCNVAGMWYAAKPEKGIRSFYGMNGKDAIKELREIRDHMEENVEEMKNMNPDNRWGSFEGALKFVNDLIIESLNNPKLVWDGD